MKVVALQMGQFLNQEDASQIFEILRTSGNPQEAIRRVGKEVVESKLDMIREKTGMNPNIEMTATQIVVGAMASLMEAKANRERRMN